MAQVEQRFRELPMEARRSIGLQFWLHGDESKERLETHVAREPIGLDLFQALALGLGHEAPEKHRRHQTDE